MVSYPYVLERIQLCTLEEIYPNLGYQEALQECSITTLNQWHFNYTQNTIKLSKTCITHFP